MTTFILKRLLQACAALLVFSVIVFVAPRLTGDPRALLLSPESTEEDYERVGIALGLDKPVIVQYGIYMGNVLKGDLGRSLRSHEDVGTLLRQRLPPSVSLGLLALLISLAIGIPFGTIAAVFRGTPIEAGVKFVALLGQSIPSFWAGILFIQVFAVGLRLVPAGTNEAAQAILLPAFTLALFGVAAITRLLRSSMLEILDSEFIKLARMKGLPGSRVVIKHALRNALMPVVSFSGFWVVTLISLGVVVETVFAWPGLGLLTQTSILTRDFPVLQGVLLLGAALAISANLAVDISYAYLDPRIRYGRR